MIYISSSPLPQQTNFEDLPQGPSIFNQKEKDEGEISKPWPIHDRNPSINPWDRSSLVSVQLDEPVDGNFSNKEKNIVGGERGERSGESSPGGGGAV